MAPARSVSAKPWMAVRGVFNSWETLATKSRRTRSSLRSSVVSCKTMTTPEVSAAVTAATVTAKNRWRSVPVTISVSTRGSPFKTRRTASIKSICLPISTSPLPDCGGTSRLRISSKPGLSNRRRSEALTTATPSTMLPRMAEERLRSSVSVRIVRSRRTAVSLREPAKASMASPERSASMGRKSPSATRRENAVKRSTRSEKEREINSEAAPVTRSMTKEASQSLLNLRASRVVFHRFRVGLGIRQDPAVGSNDGDTDAAGSHRRYPVKKWCRLPVRRGGEISRLWRMSKCDTRDGREFFETGAFIVAPQGPLGIEIDGQQDRDQQSEKRETEFPEEIKPHGFQTNSPHRERFSSARDSRDQILFFRAAGERKHPRCGASQS